MRGRKPDYESLLREREAMSIQQYVCTPQGPYPVTAKELADADYPGLVLYADHVRAVAEAERQVLSRLGEWQKHSPLGGKTYAQGYAAGLDAAREAVEMVAQSGAYIEYVEIGSALAAIDALRGKP